MPTPPTVPEPPTPPLTVTLEHHSSTLVAHCRGKLLSSTSDILYQPIADLFPGHRHIILDLDGLTQMDSMGLGALVRLAVSARNKGCHLELRNLGKKVRDLLILTNLLSVFTVVGEHGVKHG